MRGRPAELPATDASNPGARPPEAPLFIAILAPQGNCARALEGAPYPDLGEPSRALRHLALGLAGLGHRVEVVTRRIEDPALPQLAEAAEEIGLDTQVTRLEFGPTGYRRKEELWPVIREYAARVIERHAGEPPDAYLAIHAQGGLAGALIAEETGRGYAWLPRSLGAAKLRRLGATEANLAALDARFQFARRIAGERGALAFADLVIIGAAVEYDRVLALPAYRGVLPPRVRCRVVPPGIDATHFQPQARGEGATRAAIAEALQEDLHAARMDGPMVVVPGGSHRGGVELVEAALAAEPALAARASLVRVTPFDDPELESWRARLEQRGLPGSAATVTAGEPAARAALYRWLAARGSLLVVPGPHATGLAEGLEAAACGLPVIADAESVVGLALGAEGRAELTDTTSPKALAGALRRMLERPTGWAREQAETVALVHAWPEVAARLEPALARVAGGRRCEAVAPLHPYFESGDAALDVSLAELRALIFPEEGD